MYTKCVMCSATTTHRMYGGRITMCEDCEGIQLTRKAQQSNAIRLVLATLQFLGDVSSCNQSAVFSFEGTVYELTRHENGFTFVTLPEDCKATK